jgi:Outer membrane protein beta-barrel domain
MKRMLLLALLGLGMSPFAHSQSVRLGVTGGLATTRLLGAREAGAPVPQWRLGVRSGLAAQALLAPSGRLALQTELLYAGQGFRLNESNDVTTFRLRLHYLQLPVLAQLKLANVWLEAGPQVSYLLGGQAKTGAGSLLGSPTRSAIDKNNFNRWEAGYVVGAGYQCTERLRAGLRYTGGFAPAAKPGGLIGDSNAKTQALSLQLTYLLGL